MYMTWSKWFFKFKGCLKGMQTLMVEVSIAELEYSP
jgi:hypothetical protein